MLQKKTGYPEAIIACEIPCFDMLYGWAVGRKEIF